jgi:hypothetical protein
MYLEMNLLEDPLKIRPIRMGREMSIKPYPNRHCRLIDDFDHPFGDPQFPPGPGTVANTNGVVLVAFIYSNAVRGIASIQFHEDPSSVQPVKHL